MEPNPNIKFTLSGKQLKAVKKQGLEPILCGKVDETADFYQLEVEPTQTAILIKAVFRWGKEEGKEIAYATGRVRKMYPEVYLLKK